MVYGARVARASRETLRWVRERVRLVDLAGRCSEIWRKLAGKAKVLTRRICVWSYRASLRVNPLPPRSRVRRYSANTNVSTRCACLRRKSGNDTEVSRRSRGETEEVAREKKTGARFPFHDSVARRTLVCRSAPASSVPCLAHARVCQPVYRAPRAYASRARPRSCRRARARHSGEMRNAGWKKPILT